MSRRLGQEVKRRRSELGMSQAAVVRTGYVTLATLGAIERGVERAYHGPTLAGLDRALGWPVGHSQGILDAEHREAVHAEPWPDREWLEALLIEHRQAITETVAATVLDLQRLPSPLDEIVLRARRLEPRDLATVLRLMRSLVGD